MAKNSNDTVDGGQAGAESPAEDQVVKTTDGTLVEAQPNDPANSPAARDAAAQAAATQAAKDEKSGAAVQDEEPKEASEPVTTTTDNEGNQVTLGHMTHTGPSQVINGPEESYNPARPGVSPDWPAARTLDEEHDPGQNDGLTAEEAERQAQEENPERPNGDAPETAEQP